MKSFSTKSPLLIQRKAQRGPLPMGHAHDAAEQEADAIAEQVVRPLSESGGTISSGLGQGAMRGKPMIQAKGNVGQMGGAEAPTHVVQGIHATRGGGNGLDGKTKTEMEGRFGQPLDGVRIHTGGYAEQLSEQVNARAFTVGQDIYFNRGEYQPGTPSGQRLLAHELVHTQQQSGVLQREDKKAPAETEMTREDFDKTMKSTYGINEVLTATKADTLAAYSLAPDTTPDPFPDWKSWDPGTKSAIYKDILDSFAEMDKKFGGVPKVARLIFSDAYYDKDTSTNTWKKDPDAGGLWDGKDISVYSTITKRDKGLPFARSNAKGEYPGKPILVHDYKGDDKASPIGFAGQQNTTKRIIIHELGHALESAISSKKVGAENKPVDIGLISAFADTVGWYQFKKLYDKGVAEVKEALGKNTEPSSAFEITESNWNDSKWIEQPVSDYAVKGKPSEDFAESIMTFVENEALLKSRSPLRHAFIESRKASWLPALQKTPVAGQPAATPQAPAPSLPANQGSGPALGPRPLSPILFGQPNPLLQPGAFSLPSPQLIDWLAMRREIEGRGVPYDGPMQDSVQSTWMQSYRFYNQVLQLPPSAAATWTNRTMPMMIGSALSRDNPTPMERTDRALNTTSIIIPVSDILKILMPK